MVLYLHIGTEKTGTTSIQGFLAANRARLAENGILYPSAPGEKTHLGLAAWAQKKGGGELWRRLGIVGRKDFERFRTRLEADLADELFRVGPAKTIMSSEHCSSRLLSEDEITALHGMLSKLFSEIRIVIYIRRQDEFVRSTYSTHVKTGHTTLLAYPTDDKIARRYDYWDLLNRWSRVFGRDRLICRKFESGQLVGGDVVKDFCSTTGVNVDRNYERLENRNVSLDANCLEFLRLMNRHFQPGWKSRKIVEALEAASNGPLLDLPPDARCRLMEQVRQSNLLVAREYFGGEIAGSDDPLFDGVQDERPRVSQAALDVEAAVTIASSLVALLSDEDRKNSRRKRSRKRNRLGPMRRHAMKRRRLSSRSKLPT